LLLLPLPPCRPQTPPWQPDRWLLLQRRPLQPPPLQLKCNWSAGAAGAIAAAGIASIVAGMAAMATTRPVYFRGGCHRLKRKWHRTGSRYWRKRYYRCVNRYY
jgi:hypothetical protein